jgi:hypothetical protein
MDFFIKILIYFVALGSIIAYFFVQRRQQGSYRRIFNENFMALGLLTQKSSLTHDDEVALISYFLECYWVFEGIIFPDYLDGLYPDTVQSASAWEVRALQLRELYSEQKISQHQLDVLLDMKNYILFVETVRWPGISYSEKEFYEKAKKKIYVYFETMRELLAMIEQE